MTKFIYTENDVVLKQPKIEDLLEECSLLGLNLKKAGPREELEKGFEKARREETTVLIKSLNLVAGWDDTHDEYFVVLRDVYDPRNLMAVLFERIVAVEEEDPEEDLRNIRKVISDYLGVIEQKEKVSLQDARERLFSLSAEMKKALALFEEDEYSEEDFEKLSDALDKAYFEPLSEILEGVLVTIAGN
jgi:vacuolar-type H+-ATPase subunit C/Vma6